METWEKKEERRRETSEENEEGKLSKAVFFGINK